MKSKYILRSLLLSSLLLTSCSITPDAAPQTQTNLTPTNQNPSSSNPTTPANPTNQNQTNPPVADTIVRGWNTTQGVTLSGSAYQNSSYHVTKIRKGSSSNICKVEGKLRAFEAVGIGIIKGPDGKVLIQPNTKISEIIIHASQGAPEWGDFIAEFSYPASVKGQIGTLELFVESPKDGSKQNLLQIQIAFE